jgi:hypothetical protein
VLFVAVEWKVNAAHDVPELELALELEVEASYRHGLEEAGAWEGMSAGHVLDRGTPRVVPSPP